MEIGGQNMWRKGQCDGGSGGGGERDEHGYCEEWILHGIFPITANDGAL